MVDGSQDTDGQPRRVKSADRTLAVLEHLAANTGAHDLASLSVALRIPKSSLHALLRTMQERGWLEVTADGASYRLGVRALRVGASYVESDDVVARTSATMDRLSSELGETVHLGRLDGADIVYLAKRESKHPLRLYSAIGRRLPAHATALGKCLLAELEDGEVRSLFDGPLARLTPKTIASVDTLLEELAVIRERGYSIDNEENTPGIHCFAVTVPAGGGGRRENALSVSIPAMRLTATVKKHAIARLRDAVGHLGLPDLEPEVR